MIDSSSFMFKSNLDFEENFDDEIKELKRRLKIVKIQRKEREENSKILENRIKFLANHEIQINKELNHSRQVLKELRKNHKNRKSSLGVQMKHNTKHKYSNILKNSNSNIEFKKEELKRILKLEINSNFTNENSETYLKSCIFNNVNRNIESIFDEIIQSSNHD